MAVGNATMLTVDKILKTKYAPKLRTMTYPMCAFFASVKKDENFGGNNMRLTMRYGRPQGGSHTFGKAQSNVTSSNDGAFFLTRARDYHVCGIDAEALLAGVGDENAIAKTIDAEMAGSSVSFGRSIAMQLYGNGGGSRGRIASVVGNTITMVDPNAVVFFEVDMIVATSTGDGSAVADAIKPGVERISAIDRDIGTLRSTSATWATTITTIANNDFIFRDGDFKLSARGLAAWLPNVAPVAGDNFFGQDRSVDTTRLAGLRYVAPGGESKLDSLLNSEARLGREGGKPDAIYVSNVDRADIIRSMGTKVNYDIAKSSDGTLGFKVAMLDGSQGPVKIFADPNCPRGKFWLLQHDTWSAKSVKSIPHFVDEDGQKMLRQTTNDGFEWRMRALWQLACDGPGYNLNGTFA